jgi:DNA-binding response OmpR family regulator
MISQTLAGRSILVIEDEPLIAMCILEALEEKGARVETVFRLQTALDAVEAKDLSAAILDHGLGHDDTTRVQERLEERGIPFLLYTGYSQSERLPPSTATVVEKPAGMAVLIKTLETLLKGR